LGGGLQEKVALRVDRTLERVEDRMMKEMEKCEREDEAKGGEG
jgi:hypothetical protein